MSRGLASAKMDCGKLRRKQVAACKRSSCEAVTPSLTSGSDASGSGAFRFPMTHEGKTFDASAGLPDDQGLGRNVYKRPRTRPGLTVSLVVRLSG